MIIETKVNIGDVVYLITDVKQNQYIITGIIVRPSGLVYYASQQGHEVSVYDFEFTTKRDIVKTL